MSRNTVISSLVCIALMLAIGFITNHYAPPGEWYATLNKPPFNPPAWIFGPVWTFLYVLIGIAGGLAWTSRARAVAMPWWAGQAILNGAWSLVFFRLHAMAAALAIIALMLICIVAFIRVMWPVDRRAAGLFVPYLAWVSFAGILNASLLALN